MLSEYYYAEINCIGATLVVVSFGAFVWSHHASRSLPRPRGVTRPNNGCNRDFINLRVGPRHEHNFTAERKPKLHFNSMTLTENKKFFAVSIFLNKSKYIERGEKKNYTSKTFMWALHRGGRGVGCLSGLCPHASWISDKIQFVCKKMARDGGVQSKEA